MKKVLALVVAFALCITAVAGCFSVSATAPVFSVVAEGNVVTVSGTIAENTNYAVLLKITLDEELSLASVKDGNDNTLTQWSQTVEDNREEWHYFYNETNKVISSLELYDNTFTYVITVNAPVNESCEAASDPYTVSVVAEYADYDASAPSLEQYQGSADVVVPAADHTPAEPVQENGFMVTRCTVCNTELSREAIEVECKHENKTVVRAIPATETTPGSIDFDCPDCDKDDEIDIIDDVTYYMYYSSSGVSSSCDSEILLNIVVRQDLLKYQGEYTDLFMYTEKDIKEDDLKNPVGDVEIKIAKVDDAKEVDLSATIKGYQWDFGVASTELSDNIMSAVFVEYNGKWYNGIVRNTTVAAYSQSLIDDPETKAKTRKLLVDTLNYGAAAQINFEYNTENLANATLTEEQKALATSGTITTTNNSSNPFDATDTTDNVIVSAFSTSVESRVIINYTFNTIYYQGDITDLRAVFTYTDMKGQKVTSEYVHKSVATEEQLKKEMYFVDGPSDITFNIAFSELNAAEMRNVVNLTIYSGDRQVSCGTDYSIESYVAIEWAGANENQRNLYNEMIQYGDSALACFGND